MLCYSAASECSRCTSDAFKSRRAQVLRVGSLCSEVLQYIAETSHNLASCSYRSTATEHCKPSRENAQACSADSSIHFVQRVPSAAELNTLHTCQPLRHMPRLAPNSQASRKRVDSIWPPQRPLVRLQCIIAQPRRADQRRGACITVAPLVAPLVTLHTTAIALQTSCTPSAPKRRVPQSAAQACSVVHAHAAQAMAHCRGKRTAHPQRRILCDKATFRSTSNV
jgi:hypothetical protein